MHIYVPSRGRADDRLVRGPAAQFMGQSPVTYVVGPDEIRQYAVAMCRMHIPASVIACEHQLSGDMGLVREWIGRTARQRGQEIFCMMDDDVGLLVRRSPDTWQLRGASPADAQQMLSFMRIHLRMCDHVGVSAREGNNTFGVGLPSLPSHNTRIMRVQAFRTASFLACEHGRTRVMEDFDVALQILERGGSNVCMGYWAQGQSKTNETGGCSAWRTHEVHAESAHRLRDLHPTVVSLTEKRNKTDADGFGTRTEVVVQWKQAHRMGQSRAEVADK